MKKKKVPHLLKKLLASVLLVAMLIPIVPLITKAATFYVNGNINVSYNILDGYNGSERTYIYSFRLDTGKDRLAYCVNPSLVGPGTSHNNTTIDPVYITSANAESLGYDWEGKMKNVAKIISFGYHAAENPLYENPPCADLTLKYWEESDAAMRYLATHIAAGYAMTGSWAPITEEIARNNHIIDFMNDCLATEIDMEKCEMIVFNSGSNRQNICAISAWPVFDKGMITVQKRGEVLTSFTDGKFIWKDGGLPGVKFDVYAAEDIMDDANQTVAYANGTKVCSLTTGKDGTATTPQLFLGKYKVVETATANPQYQYVKVEKNVTISKTELNPKVSVYNDRTRWEVKIHKVNDSGEELSGGKFNFIADEDIKNAYGKVIVPAETILATCSAQNGWIKPNLDFPYGCKWRMEEMEPVPGHYKNENPLRATLKPEEDPDMETKEFTTQDGKKGLYFIFKYLDKEFPHFAYIDFEMNSLPRNF